MDKTTQTIEALKKLARQNPYAEISLVLLVHRGEFQGYDLLSIKGKFRAKGRGQIEDDE